MSKPFGRVGHAVGAVGDCGLFGGPFWCDPRGPLWPVLSGLTAGGAGVGVGTQQPCASRHLGPAERCALPSPEESRHRPDRGCVVRPVRRARPRHLLGGFYGPWNSLQSDASGNLVAFLSYTDTDYVEYVHDMANNTTWAVKGYTPWGPGFGTPFGLSNSGMIAYTLGGGDSDPQMHIYVETQSSAPMQIDTCPGPTDDHHCSRAPSMASGANLIAYEAPDVNGVNIYNIATGTTSQMTSADNGENEISDAILSVDGSKIAVDYTHYDDFGECLNDGIAVTSPSTPVSATQIVRPTDCSFTTQYAPQAVSDNGTVALYVEDFSLDPGHDTWFEIAGAAGNKLVPTVGDNQPGSIHISYDGSRLQYTLWTGSRTDGNYPGVYDWQL